MGLHRDSFRMQGDAPGEAPRPLRDGRLDVSGPVTSARLPASEPQGVDYFPTHAFNAATASVITSVDSPGVPTVVDALMGTSVARFA